MIAFLRGRLEDKSSGSVEVDVAGVGYRLAMSNNSLTTMPSLGEPVFIYTYLHVREDALQLFGFASAPEREFFERLIGVSGIGPKVALAVLSAFDVDSLKHAIINEDVALITSIPGIGKKGAQRLVLELREKLTLPETGLMGAVAKEDRSAFDEARGALLSLGYSSQEARKALDGFAPDGEAVTVELLVKHALKRLAKT
ncbi:MAG: Holliday junction branch migration protein RuvA [Actinobacteria bacterium]|nr:Holliday junction branch migration protein RuvA [Actinomycetota bacterium]